MKKQKCKEVLIKKSISVNQQKNFMYNQKHKEIIEKNRIQIVMNTDLWQ